MIRGHLGSANQCVVELGNGIQKVSTRFQSSQLSRWNQASEGTATGLDGQVSLQRVHHILHVGQQGSTHFQTKAVVLHDFGRGPHDQELSIAALEYLADVSLLSTTVVDGDASAE